MKKLICAVLLCAASVVYAGIYESAVVYEKGDYSKAFEEFTTAAQQGNAYAQFALGVMYADGQGVPQDYSQAVEWYKKAAQQGYAGAQYNLGGMYKNGQGVRQDYAQAVAWFKKVAQQGDAKAQALLGSMYILGQGVPQNYQMAYILFNLAASKGDSGAEKVRDIALKKMTPAAIADAQVITTRLHNAKDFAAELGKVLNGQK